MILIVALVSTSPDVAKNFEKLPESSRHWDPSFSMDWNEVLRRLNARVDRAVAALKVSDPQGRRRAVAEFDREMNAASSGLRQSKLLQNVALMARGILPGGTGPAQVADWVSCVLFPASPALCAAEDASASHWRLAQIALALGAFRAERGSYPASLAELVPEYLADLPKDPGSGGDFHYNAKPDSYLLSGVNPKHFDNGGHEPSAAAGTDEFVIRAPLP
jgi:hypothetical protein